MFAYDYFTRRVPWAVVMRDRADGSLWLLNTTTEEGAHPVSILSIEDEKLLKANVIYTIGRDVVVSQEPALRLIIRSGVLGYEYFENERIAAPPSFEPVSTKNGQRTNPAWLVQTPSNWESVETLSAQELTP